MDKTLIGRVPEHLRRAGQPWWFALRLYAFWLLFFAFFRLLFVAWLRENWNADGPWASFWYALPLDFSMAGYLVAPAVFLWYAGILIRPSAQPFLRYALLTFHLGLLLFMVLAFTANIFIYAEWHTPLNSRAFDHFRIPGAMLDSMSAAFKVGGLALYVCLTWVWWRVFLEFSGKQLATPERSFAHLPAGTVLLVSLFLLIRGGLGKMPINESAVYYSGHLFNNHAATNTAWHFMHSLIETRSTQNHYRYLSDESARKVVEELYAPNKTSNRAHSWLSRSPAETPPNVVFILMESMTAQVLEELGGEKGVCPNLSRLAGTGILFERCYGSGYRTDQGLVSILGGFPAQPDQSVVLLQDKAAKLPSVSKLLKKAGYATAFFYGGQLTFANMGTWLYNQEFQTLQKKPTPFFATVMTLSLHQPYDVPYKSRWTGNTEREKFLNCAAFADHAIGEFFRQAAQAPWFDNTVFVLVADHGHPQPGNINMNTPRARQVPLIITGPRINPEWRGRRIGKLGNHHDIPATVLDELGISSTPFTWSKDLLNERTPDFAYYSNENGLGWITPQGAGFFPFAKQEWQEHSGNLTPESRNTARAYLQVLYDVFLGL
ncbi:MAG: sulfatase-like hydrolase/transferase [Lewinellaceae bacterium]|nr:sulfatase-like hydrolase/transferase [Lewinellaceae bacterium]